MRRIVALVVAAAMACALAGIATAGAQDGAERQGVTAKEIRVGGVVGKTNPVGQPYASGFDGTQAFFDYINSKGGVFDRKFKLVSKLDDQSRASQNVAQCRALNEEEKVFAVVPIVTQIFACGGYLHENGIPGFGWNINAEYCSTATRVSNEINAGDVADTINPGDPACDRLGLFGDKGSYLCFTCNNAAPAFIAHELGLTKVAVLAYTASQSVECSKGIVAAYERYGLDLVYQNTSLAFGFQNLGDAVQEIRDAGVEFIGTCMDIAGEVQVARLLRRAGLDDIKFYAPQGYDPGTLEKYGDELNNIFFATLFTPFEVKDKPKGLRLFLKWMKKNGKEPNEQALAGWMGAALLYEGIKLAGKGFTRQSVVDAINTITDWTADGIRTEIDWSTDGHGPGLESCAAFVEAKDGKFIPRYGKPGQPFVCFQDNPPPADFESPYYKPLKPGESVPPLVGA